jgi:hypothetical protein
VTIRDYIKRRVRWGFGIAFASWLLLPASQLLGIFQKVAQLTLTLIGVFGFMGAILSFLFIRCPKCHARLGQTIAMPAAFRLFGPQVKYCPYCAVSLDEPMDRPAG